MFSEIVKTKCRDCGNEFEVEIIFEGEIVSCPNCGAQYQGRFHGRIMELIPFKIGEKDEQIEIKERLDKIDASKLGEFYHKKGR
jgi:DNA-directed RNA polymerase subunit RPC12/RpoP